MKRRSRASSSTAAPDAFAAIASRQALRVVSDDRRHRMLSLLIQEPLTAADVAARLRLPRTRVYYHLELLAEHGFIRVVEERPAGRRVESVYRAVARNFKVDATLLNQAGPAVARARPRLLEATLDHLRTRSALRRRAGARYEPLLARKLVRVDAAGYAELRRRLAALFDGVDAARSQGQLVELAIALFPVDE